MSGFVRDVAAGAVVGYALSSALDDPRRMMRRLVTGALLGLISFGVLLFAAFGRGGTGSVPMSIIGSIMGILWILLGIWAAAKWFSKARVKTLRILHFVISSVRDSMVGRILWIALGVLFLANIVVSVTLGAGAVALIIKLGYLVCMYGLGWVIASLANLHITRLFEVQELVARVMGVSQHQIDVVSTGSELAPEYTAVLPKLLKEAEANGLAKQLDEYCQPLYIVGEFGQDFVRLRPGRT